MNSSAASELRAGPVAVRYATALFQLARDRGQLDAVTRDVGELAALLGRTADSDWIFDARVAAKDKRERIERIASGFSPLTANFLRLVADKRRLELLRELPTAFKRCVLQERGAVEGHVESARPMAAGELAELSVALGALLGKQVSLEASVDPALIAGARIVVDNRMLDLSAQGRLEELRTRLNSARLH
ncbi:MAG TPA: ATP synthase F1 subunit delta [Planctomycetota bacterium]|nr:ATP synthase F1 subunit delta [Planctomycetota bacterium]